MSAPQQRCRFEWCETSASTHEGDPSHHTRELGFGMLLAVDLEGKPHANWMPDWSEWWTESANEIETEYAAVATMLRDLKANYDAFREALTADPLFAAEVQAAREMDK